jgi:type IV pilus assembly protein PilB
MEILGIDEPVTIARPHGCQFCNNTGYKGRIAVHELMYMNESMKNAVLTEKNLDVLRKLAIENGMTPLWNSCKNLVEKGITSIQELMSLNIE